MVVVESEESVETSRFHPLTKDARARFGNIRGAYTLSLIGGSLSRVCIGLHARYIAVCVGQWIRT